MLWGTQPQTLQARADLLSVCVCYRTGLGSVHLTHSKANLLMWGCGETFCKVPGRGPSKENGQLVRKRSELPDGFQARFFKDKVSCKVHDQLGHILLIGWWGDNGMMFWESQLSTFWFQLAWCLPTGSQHAVSFFHLVGVLVSAKQWTDIGQNII